jgi:Ulp1 family protease
MFHCRAHQLLTTGNSILVYPPTGPGALNITNGLVKRLAPGEFLNDTLIEFGLKYATLAIHKLLLTISRLWLNDLRETSPQLSEDVHVFNSFFYKKLDVKG